jgi:hypothetical protein
VINPALARDSPPRFYAISSSRAMNSRWPERIFARAISSENHSARSTSGKVALRPLFGGHSSSCGPVA